MLVFAAVAWSQTERELEDLFWREVVCEDEREVEAYLQQYPSGAYVADARTCLAVIDRRAKVEARLGLDRQACIWVQRGLTVLDYQVGAADGLFDSATRTALRQWQREEGVAVTGYLTQAQADTLIATGRAAARRQAHEAAVRRAEEAERQRVAREAERQRAAQQRAEEAERQRAAQEAERQRAAQQRAEEAERQRLAQEAERQRLAQEAERQRLAQEAERQRAAQQRAEEAERQRAAQQRAERQRLAAARQVQEAARQREANELVNTIGMEFMRIEPGTFQMGLPTRRVGRSDEISLHTVQISQPFYLGKYEVTQSQWQAVLGNNPSRFAACGDTCPVESVSWEDAQTFIEALNLREATTAYRLPTEAEWEYATRAGTRTAYSFGSASRRLEAHGWYKDNAGNTTHPVGSKRPNAWGLHDLHGNVWEWVADWYGDYPLGRVTDPRGPSSGTRRVIRGGGWRYEARDCRSGSRAVGAPDSRSPSVGLRLVRVP